MDTSLPQKFTIIHTTTATVDSLKALAAEILPGWMVVNFVDDSILPQLADNGGDMAEVAERLCAYARFAEQVGSRAILSACSSVGELVPQLQRQVSIPVVRIDEAMAEEAIRRGARLGVAATLATTLGPTVRLLERKAAEAGTAVQLQARLVDGAYQRLMTGDRAGHDDLLAASSAETVRPPARWRRSSWLRLRWRGSCPHCRNQNRPDSCPARAWGCKGCDRFWRARLPEGEPALQALDIGTTHTKAALISLDGKALILASRATPLQRDLRKQPGDCLGWDRQHGGDRAAGANGRGPINPPTSCFFYNLGVRVCASSVRKASMGLHTLEMACRMLVSADSTGVGLQAFPAEVGVDYPNNADYQRRREWLL